MGKYTLERLEQDTERWYEGHRAKQKRRYELARELGFSSTEAVILQGKTEEVIRLLAREKLKSNK